MDASVEASLRRMDACRGDWWLVRMDFWEPNRWDLSCDPHAGWDWRWKVGSANSWAVRRLQAANEARWAQRNRALKVQRLRRIVDKMHP